MNEIYAGYFTGDYPARETVAVKGLPKNVNVEISVIASDKNNLPMVIAVLADETAKNELIAKGFPADVEVTMGG